MPHIISIFHSLVKYPWRVGIKKAYLKAERDISAIPQETHGSYAELLL